MPRAPWLGKLLDLLYPPQCVLCGAGEGIDDDLCPACRAAFVRESFARCPRCGRSAHGCVCGSEFLAHTRTSLAGRSSVVLTFYDSHRQDDARVTETMLYRLKERGSFADFFASLLEREVRLLFAETDEPLAGWTLTYPPRSEENYRRYGFDQGEEIVSRLSKRLGIPYRKTLLRRTDGQVQKSLDSAGRRANAEASLLPRPHAIEKGGRYLLFDDIITSGATVVTAARTLYFHGADAVFPIAIARTIPPKIRQDGSSE